MFYLFTNEGSSHDKKPSQNTIYFWLLNVIKKASQMAERDREKSIQLPITKSFIGL